MKAWIFLSLICAASSGMIFAADPAQDLAADQAQEFARQYGWCLATCEGCQGSSTESCTSTCKTSPYAYGPLKTYGVSSCP